MFYHVYFGSEIVATVKRPSKAYADYFADDNDCAMRAAAGPLELDGDRLTLVDEHCASHRQFEYDCIDCDDAARESRR